jgi:hypothetical protein
MAMPRTWLPRAEEILDVLRRMKSRQLDRAAIEELFQLQRRAAIDLMNQVGTTGTRATGFLVDRTPLLSWVERISKEEAWQLERRAATAQELSHSLAEVQAVRAALHAAGKQQISFPIVAEVLQASFASLPPAIQIEPGRVTVLADHPDPHARALAACQLLYALGAAMANDFDSFQALLCGDTAAPVLSTLIASQL